MGAQRYENVTF